MPTDPVASLWILAAPEDEAMLSGIVETLAARHGAPRFQPHLTLLGDLPFAPEALATVADRIAGAAPAFTLPVRDVVTGEAFFRSFYALFDIGAALGALRAAAEAALNRPQSPFMPHVSLLYGAVPDGPKQQSAAAMRSRLTGRPIHFDRLVVTRSADHVPVAEWRVVHTAWLG